MRFHFTYFIFFLLFFNSCKKEYDNRTEIDSFQLPQIKKIDGFYLATTEEHFPSPKIAGTGLFEFNNNRIVKRIGGRVAIPAGAGSGFFYTSELYDTVMYKDNNLIIIESRSSSPNFITGPAKREYTIQNGLVIKKISYDVETSRLDTDTMHYEYDAFKKLVKTKQYFKSNMITRDYIYDINDNLQRITTFKMRKSDGFIYYSIEETFGGYDNKINPLKGPSLWQDMLYRSLSKNNFTTYNYNQLYNSGSVSSGGINSVLHYDANGIVDFSF